MAVDKNSKAYQSLQKSGYSDEQISQMHQQVAQGNTPQSVVSGNPRPQTPMVDPIAYRPENNTGRYDKYIEGWDPRKLNNADVNLSQYGDDSSAKNYNNSALRGGENQKYTGENTLGSQLAYNPNATIEGLDPNYLYGQSAQMQNSKDANYIARRNDEIASALYNEGKVTIQDVANFLSQQNQWDYSNENERQNTIMSVWKRIGQIAEQNKQQEPAQEEQKQPEGEPKPEMELEETPGGVIYGRASGDEGVRIETQADPNSPEAISIRGRQNNYKSLQSMNSYDIALSLSAGNSLFGEQAMRDLSQFDPQKYQEVQSELKKIQQGETVNAIASGEKTNAVGQTDKSDEVVNDSISKWTEVNSTERTRDQVQGELTSKLENSQTAQTATQEMLNIKSQIAEIEEEMANLPNEARKAFKGDVPQYIVDAYVANKSQRLQSELNKLQSRYNGAIELYKTELAQKQREVEMDLKNRQFNFDVNQSMRERNFKATQQAWENDYKTKSLLMNSIKTDANGNPFIVNPDGTYEYLTDATVLRMQQAQQQQIQDGLNTLNTTRKDGMDGGQCEAFSDTWNNKVYGQTMLPVDANGNIINGRNFTYSREKIQYVNSAIPKPGSTAIFDYSGYNTYSKNAQLYGHTMIVTAYDPATGMITMKGSNKDGKEKVYTSTMSLRDFNTKYHGAGFWDPTQPTWFQKDQDQPVNTTTSSTEMNTLYGSLITNAGTQGTKDSLATAQTMYNVLTQIRDDGSLEHLVESGDLEKVLNSLKVKKFTNEDGGSEFANQLRDAISKKIPDTQSQIALNKLLGLVEMKLRKESGAAISSSEWLSNFERMIPSSYENIDLMRAKLTNWDDIIRMYSVAGGMGWNEYQPLFNNEYLQRGIYAG